jgi:hypothetical protein
MSKLDFDGFLSDNDIPFAIVANVSMGEIQSFGDSLAISNTDLVNNLFADAECITAMQRSLQGQMLPRIWRQGQVSCVVCKPTDGIIVGFFCKDEREPVERYRWAKQLCVNAVSLWV